jgi:leukotriene A-4 hydrolase/aminopeptidase
MAASDPHSYADPVQPAVKHVDWVARVDFHEKTLTATATLVLTAPTAGVLDLDTRDLVVSEITTLEGHPIPFELSGPSPILGARLRLRPEAPVSAVRIAYRTSPKASALQWLSPAQTAGGRHPYLFTQCQAIHARSVVPLQDTPRARITYSARVTVPRGLRVLMAAAHEGRTEDGEWATERFEMKQPIPPYLFALAAGDLASRDLGDRSRVWAEPKVLEAAAHEFAEVDQMLVAAERLLGPYDWERFDLLTMPPSFPYGGMENPRLTFLTPTLLAGDRSLVNVVAHELAHSWTGNLVSNASAEHFWLNEGFTVYAERQLLRAIEGDESAALHAAMGRHALEETFKQLQNAPGLTRLRTNLKGVDPDEAYSLVPYEKGCLFLTCLEGVVGRPRMLEYLKAYAKQFRFQSITTDDFLAFTEQELPGALEKARWQEWVDGEGLPANAPQVTSARLSALKTLGNGMPSKAQADAWKAVEWQVYLSAQPSAMPVSRCEALDQAFGLTQGKNYEILVEWLGLSVRSGYGPAIARTQQVLGEVGRMKYLKPLYMALLSAPATRPIARACFEQYRQGYHPIAVHVVEKVLAQS